MACMDHECAACGYAWMDNSRASWCPKCSDGQVTNHFDEPLEDFDRDEPLDGDADDD